MMKTARQIAFDTLFKVFANSAYSNLALDKELAASKIDSRDRAFVSKLVYGVIERKLTLDFAISKYLKKPLKKLDCEIVIILEIGFYQLLYMDSVPNSAAVSETVSLCGYVRKVSAKGFVNAIMRSFLRDDLQLDGIENNPSIKYSCPQPLIDLWTEQYGQETAEALARESISEAPLSVRVNTLKTDSATLLAAFQKRGINAKQHELLENCILLYSPGDITALKEFEQGLFHVQDISSQLCVEALAPKKGERVLDLCSAPGSKAFTAAELMKDSGEIVAFDIHKHKIPLIQKGAARLGITSIKADIGNALSYSPEIGVADCVLCDVPCSGLGIIRRKPEIKYKDISSFDELPETQLAILTNGSRYLRKGGRLLYSTCTTNKKENQEVIERFLKANNFFKPLQLPPILDKIKGSSDFAVTLLPNINGCDGFFFALLEKTEESK